jgi:hypothetical protein
MIATGIGQLLLSCSVDLQTRRARRYTIGCPLIQAPRPSSTVMMTSVSSMQAFKR